ncbi:hypothetical protein CYMTET_19463 [Cymbomonas tetramitiformis]|uniref:Uncharacterized protein n=1 Tax=Cymbomonas tetramitiformis TaxID=36881 RepID=A0AAE0G5Z5_9CHLO|nr:hypothetical protein CYMTET_19463 [Cymbomonas tetramitiformis]
MRPTSLIYLAPDGTFEAKAEDPASSPDVVPSLKSPDDGGLPQWGGGDKRQRRKRPRTRRCRRYVVEDSVDSDNDASRCSCATAASMEDLITASEFSDIEQGLTDSVAIGFG